MVFNNMREIKFKAKKADNGEWVYGYYAKTVTSEDVFCVADTRINDIIIIKDGTFYYIRSETLSQYTGLKDKNGKEVYEGDIIKYSSDVIKEFYEVNSILREVKFKYGMYGIQGFEEGTHIPFANILKCQYEVVGNIYENKDLLEDN